MKNISTELSFWSRKATNREIYLYISSVLYLSKDEHKQRRQRQEEQVPFGQNFITVSIFQNVKRGRLNNHFSYRQLVTRIAGITWVELS